MEIGHQEGKLKYQVKSPENFWSGVLFIGFGLAALVLSRDYSIGSTMNMGPGYFPTVLGFLLIVLGAVIAITAFKIKGEGIKSFAWRPMILLSAAFVFFGWGVERLGFIPSLLALVLLCAAAGSEFKWKELLIISTVLVVGSWVLFLAVLELPFQPFWWR